MLNRKVRELIKIVYVSVCVRVRVCVCVCVCMRDFSFENSQGLVKYLEDLKEIIAFNIVCV